MNLSDDLTTLTDEKLAIWHAEAKGRFEYEILAEREWERRARIKEHNPQPEKPWHETFVGKVVVGVIVGIILFFATVFITRHIISTPQQPPMLEQQQKAR